MNILLIFFAIPIAVIILSVIFETYMKSPLKVAGIFFSIFLVLAIYLGGTAEYIVAALVYTLISFISAYFIRLIYSRRYYQRDEFPNFYREAVPRRISNSEFELPNNTENIPNFNTELDNVNNFNTCYRRY